MLKVMTACQKILLPKNIDEHIAGEVCFFKFHLTFIPTCFEYDNPL